MSAPGETLHRERAKGNVRQSSEDGQAIQLQRLMK